MNSINCVIVTKQNHLTNKKCPQRKEWIILFPPSVAVHMSDEFNYMLHASSKTSGS